MFKTAEHKYQRIQTLICQQGCNNTEEDHITVNVDVFLSGENKDAQVYDNNKTKEGCECRGVSNNLK